ncbi:MAG TPA: hypothetical protein VFI28_04390 [Candidatus Limnocylindrales bacterium]|nr:hypothetical protein [Candidatus Limnocylindrales bacterium]
MDDRTVDGGRSNTPLELSPDELELVRTALRLLESTLGREEADELEDVQALIRRLDIADRR